LGSVRDLTYRLKNKDKIDKLNTSGPVRACRILEELGPTYIKLGQLLRNDENITSKFQFENLSIFLLSPITIPSNKTP
jgi:predicted unusual protein kinase regulating ubiquinone biosynthesis (AarF/ABC1/UbiB family)